MKTGLTKKQKTTDIYYNAKDPPCGSLHPRYEPKEAAAEVCSQIPGTVQAD